MFTNMYLIKIAFCYCTGTHFFIAIDGTKTSSMTNSNTYCALVTKFYFDPAEPVNTV